jgi:hypothetical protein
MSQDTNGRYLDYFQNTRKALRASVVERATEELREAQDQARPKNGSEASIILLREYV